MIDHTWRTSLEPLILFSHADIHYISGRGLRRMKCGYLLVVSIFALSACMSPRDDRRRLPELVSSNQIRARINALPEYTRFAFSGVAFYNDKLYASSNIGLVVISGDEVDGAYSWFEGDDVVSGPWNDPANGVLWIQNAHDLSFERFDGSVWRTLALPESPKGVYSRGDLSYGFRGFGMEDAFRLVGAGFVWRFDPEVGRLILEERPPISELSAVRAVAPLANSLLYIVREGIEVPPMKFAAYDRDRGWFRQFISEMTNLGDVVATEAAVYVRSNDGAVFEITPTEINEMLTPGKCEAMTRSSDGHLLASFTGAGIYRWEDRMWHLKASYPYGEAEGSHWAYLAEWDGRIAYATASRPNRKDPFTYSGTVALWTLRAGKLHQISIP